MLENLYKLEAENILVEIAVASAPHMESQQRIKLVESYQRQATDMIDLMEPKDNFSNVDELRGALEGKI